MERLPLLLLLMLWLVGLSKYCLLIDSLSKPIGTKYVARMELGERGRVRVSLLRLTRPHLE